METLLGPVGLIVLVVLFVVGAIVLAFSLDKPTTDNPNFVQSVLIKASNGQKWIFLGYVVVGPLYLLLDWFFYGSTLESPKLEQFKYTQKLVGDLWSAGAIMFGLFWGLKKQP